MPGVVLGEGASAAAGSVVSSSIPALEIHSGNPAEFRKYRAMRTHMPAHRDPATDPRPCAWRPSRENPADEPVFLARLRRHQPVLTDLAVEMAARGHEVHVICAGGNYAVASGERQPAVAIHRLKALTSSRGKLGRILSYPSFYLGAAWLALTLPRPELVVTLTTPPLLSLLGALIKTVRGSRHLIWEMDVHPDVAISLGYFKAGGLLDRSVSLLADFSRRRADGILALGECMKDRLAARGIAREKLLVAENWADSVVIQPVPASRLSWKAGHPLLR